MRTPRTPAPVDAERAVLGSVMTRPELLGEVLEHLCPADFHLPEHAALLELMRVRAREGRDIGMIGLPEAIVAMQAADRYGGVPYVLMLPDAAPSERALPAWMREVREASVRRKLIAQVEELAPLLGSGEPGPVLSQMMETVSQLHSAGRDSETLHDVLGRVLASLDDVASGRRPAAMSTGLPELDEILGGGLRPGMLTVLAGRPSMGKTAVAMSIARALVEGGHVVGVCSIEMAADLLVARMLADLASVPMDHIVAPEMMDQQDWQAVVDARERVQGWPLYVHHQSSMTAEQVAAQTRAWMPRGLDVLVVDHLSEMAHPDMGTQALAVSWTTQALRDLGKRLGIHVILLQQLSRRCDERQNKRPMNSDLRDSGKIEEAADVIAFIYRDHVYDESADPEGMEIIVTKNRMGRIGTADVRWRGMYQRVGDDRLFEEVTRAAK